MSDPTVIETASAGTEDAARDALRTVWDPELGVDIVTLGLVYDIRATDDTVEIDMTLTTPGCPVSEQLPREAGTAVATALPSHRVTVNTVWDPPWTPERLSPEATQQLGFAPATPPASAVTVGGRRRRRGRTEQDPSDPSSPTDPSQPPRDGAR